MLHKENTFFRTDDSRLGYFLTWGLIKSPLDSTEAFSLTSVGLDQAFGPQLRFFPLVSSQNAAECDLYRMYKDSIFT